MTTPQPQAPAGVALTDEQIIQRAEAAGMKWLPPDDEDEGFPGAFDLSSIDNVRRLLSTPAGQAWRALAQSAEAPAQEPEANELSERGAHGEVHPNR